MSLLKIETAYRPLSDQEIAEEATSIRMQLQRTGTACISSDFLDRCQFDDCLRLLDNLSFPTLRLCVPLKPSIGSMYLTAE